MTRCSLKHKRKYKKKETFLILALMLALVLPSLVKTRPYKIQCIRTHVPKVDFVKFYYSEDILHMRIYNVNS